MKKIINSLKQKDINSGVKNALISLRDERGDTNFVSIAIVLTVVLVLAGIFIVFGRQIIEGVQTAIEEFLSIFNG